MWQDQRELEQIRLYGGPRDGQRHDWRGGDVIEFVEKARKSFILKFLDQILPQPETLTYRRSLKTKHLFVFQP